MSTEPLPIRRRRAARVVVLDDDGAVLLLHDSDPGAPGQPTWWITPGGGIEGDEEPDWAASRELEEETGQAVYHQMLAGPVWQRKVTHVFSDHVGVQDETFFVLSTSRFTPTNQGFTESERESILGHRWWSLAELRATTDDVWPRELADLLEPILADRPGPHNAPEPRWRGNEGYLSSEFALIHLPEAFEDPGGGPPR